MKGIRNELMNRVAKRADTEGTQINAAEVRRVVALTLDELLELLSRVREGKARK